MKKITLTSLLLIGFILVFIPNISFASTTGYNPDRTDELRNSLNSKIVTIDPLNSSEYVEGEYAFVPKFIKGVTKIKFVIGSDITEVTTQEAITFTQSDVNKGAYIYYENVGLYQGRVIDLVQEIAAVSDKVTIGTGKKTDLLYSQFLGISATGSKNSDTAKIRYTFKYHETQEQADLNFYLTFIDIDREESISISDTNIQNVYVRKDSPIVGDLEKDNELYVQAPKRSSWWDNDWNVKSTDETRWISVTINRSSTFTLDLTTSTTAIDESTVSYASQSLVPLAYPFPYKESINNDINKDNQVIEYSIMSYVPGKVIPVPEPKYQIKDNLPEQFNIQKVTAMNAETGESVPFDISITDSTLIIDAKNLLKNKNFYGNLYIFTIKGTYEKGDLSSFKPTPNSTNYVDIPNVANLVVSNVDETDRILKSNEANAPILLPKGVINVRYLDGKNNELAPSKTLEGEIGTSYNVEPINISGYRYKQLSENSAPLSGAFSNSLKKIEFIYEKLIPVKNVTVKYVNTLGEKLEEVILSGNIGEEFKTEQKVFPGYKFKKVEGPTTGKFTDQTQTITYTYTSDVLRFYEVPSELSFNETKISTTTKTATRKDANWKIVVEDSRLRKDNWRVTAKLVEQFKDSTGSPLKNDILLFRKGGSQSDQWINSDNEVNVFSGISTNKNELYDVSWNKDAGTLIQVAPGTVKVGKYRGLINWSLIDAPV